MPVGMQPTGFLFQKSFDKLHCNHTEYLIVFCIFLYLFVLFFFFIFSGLYPDFYALFRLFLLLLVIFLSRFPNFLSEKLFFWKILCHCTFLFLSLFPKRAKTFSLFHLPFSLFFFFKRGEKKSFFSPSPF